MPVKKEIWIGTLEIRPLADSKLLEGASGAFVNILMWASNPAEFRVKAQTLMHHLRLEITKLEGAEPLRNRLPLKSPEGDIAKIVTEMQSTSDAIRYGTFHTWSEPVQ